ncbi:MAG: permease-like cell division protein FtsX [Clostridia bacterium]|nr:permease-like cell division protein FtsX [Clostridia bacterium]MDD4146240.1 permease-like cell division protein FtsX [Clostridia bacterium]
MRLSSLEYAFRDAFRSMKRNKVMTFASVATVAISLLILGCAWLLVLNSQHLANVMESELEINAYIKKDLTREDALNLRRKFEAIGGVAQVTFVSKEEGLKGLQERFGEDASIVDALGGNNPLPDMYRLKAKIAEDVPRIAGEVEGIPEVENVRYGQGVVEKLLALTNWMRTVGVIAVVAIGLAAIFLIATSIRITVFSRRREIGIMKLVGATNWYIRWPFFLEGMIVGLVGAVLAILSLHIFYAKLVQNVVLTLNFLPILRDTSIIFNVYKSLLLIGAFLGAAGSAISLRRFLKV